MFNLTDDIGETNDLSQEQAAKAADLAGLLAMRLKAMDAQMPVRTQTREAIPFPTAASLMPTLDGTASDGSKEDTGGLQRSKVE
jgi:hypothetical protein